ncbi:hypothetical protein ACOMHN_007374 [Nucella lapillus]
MMKPYSRRGLTDEQRICNYRISRGRRVVENAFGILANRFRCLLGTLEQKVDTVRHLVETAVVLHNLLRQRVVMAANEVYHEDEEHTIIPGAWRHGPHWEDVPQQKETATLWMPDQKMAGAVLPGAVEERSVSEADDEDED